jgi:hypothetical protein
MVSVDLHSQRRRSISLKRRVLRTGRPTGLDGTTLSRGRQPRQAGLSSKGCWRALARGYAAARSLQERQRGQAGDRRGGDRVLDHLLDPGCARGDSGAENGSREAADSSCLSSLAAAQLRASFDICFAAPGRPLARVMPRRQRSMCEGDGAA